SQPVTNATNAVVSVTALIESNYVSATQWVGGLESCQFAPGTGRVVSFNNISPVPITITTSDGNVVLTWPGLHLLQSSATGNGGFTNVPGPVLRGPYTNTPGSSAYYFRLVN